MERLLQKKNDQLGIQDACFILQFLQDQTGPLLSLRPSCSSEAQETARGHVDGRDCKPAEDLKNVTSQSEKNMLKNGSTKKTNVDLNIASFDEFPPVAESTIPSKRYVLSCAQNIGNPLPTKPPGGLVLGLQGGKVGLLTQQSYKPFSTEVCV